MHIGMIGAVMMSINQPDNIALLTPYMNNVNL